MNRRALKIIDVHSTERAITEFQSNLSDIFYIHFQWRDMAIQRPQGLNFTEQVPQIIERMRERDDHTAAEIRARRIALTVILPGMPLRQILAPMSMDG